VGILIGFLNFILVVACVAVIGLVLLQRGRGGGVAGIFGGMGADSAFGTKAATLAQKLTAIFGGAVLLIVIVLQLLWAGARAEKPAAPVPAPAQSAPPTAPAGESAAPPAAQPEAPPAAQPEAPTAGEPAAE